MSEPRPSVVILAGPNGAGKSTVAPALLHGALAVDEFVNADVIASGLSAFDPDSAAIAAGRVMLARIRELASQRVNFAFETTLASRSFAPWLRQLVTSGYSAHLVFLWLPSADFAVDRVAERVRTGGHNVPPRVRLGVPTARHVKLGYVRDEGAIFLENPDGKSEVHRRYSCHG